ncbi:Membrane protein [Leifsonia rubra CMS 76R]|nr:Membrane protein [Leifsonia rubra CMS 76R]
MELTSIGGGVMIALAAGLWLVYLVPNWLKKREYLATERNAVRLQQTIRVLAQTSELPEEVRAETVARRAAELAKARALQGPVAVGRAVTPPTRQQMLALSARRLRRTRAFTALVLLASIVVVGVQLSLIVTAGAALVSGTWLVLATAAIAGISASAMLSRLAERSRARREDIALTAQTAAPRRRIVLSSEALVEEPTARVSWTPVPVPKPMYLTRSNAPAAAVAAVAAARYAAKIDSELRAAAESAEQALRAKTVAMAAATREAELAREAGRVPTAPVTAPAAASIPNRFAGMGIVNIEGSAPDLDAALARRRRAS